MSRRPIAYITCRFPPMRTSGAYRAEAVMRYLPDHGFSPTPVTIPRSWVEQQSTAEVAASIDDAAPVLRPKARTDGVLIGATKVPVLRRAVREMLIPDWLTPWARSVVDEVASQIGNVAAVYSTSPPFSAMVLADLLAARLDVPLIHELRDPPSFHRGMKRRSQLFRNRMHAFEGRLLPRANAVITVTPRTRLRLFDLHSNLEPEKVHVVTNGYPPITPDITSVTRDPGVFTLVFTGTLPLDSRGLADRLSPTALVPHLERLPGPASLRLASKLRAGQRERLQELGGDHIEILGHLSREAAIAEVAAADVAIVVADHEDWWIGRKVFEYLAYAKRILAVVPAGDTADLLGVSPKSTVVPIGDDDALRRALTALFDEWKNGANPVAEDEPVQSDESCVAEIAAVLESVV